MKLIIVFLILIILIYLITFNNNIEHYDFGSLDSKRKICLIAGTHGNEPAPCITLLELIKNDYFKNIAKINDIYIRVIPVVNRFGYRFGIRYQNNLFRPDINRNYTKEGKCKVSKQIMNLTRDFDLVVDFHEGWGFHKINPNSIGSTLTATNNSINLADKIISTINKDILREEYKFLLLKDVCDIESLLGCYRKKINKEYILVETTGQNDIQPSSIRKKQIETIIGIVLKN